MRDSKSRTDFFVGLFKILLRRDMVRQYGQPSSFDRDFATLQSRVKNEGFSFLTKTLPLLGKAVDSALVTGEFDRPPNFKRSHGATFPAFLQVLFERVFNQDGSVKIDPCISAVKDLRQILFLVYKYEEAYNAKCIDRYLGSFTETDRLLGWSLTNEATEKSRKILDISRTLLSQVVEDVDVVNIYPQHGPGAVATGEKNWEKMNFSRKYNCIHQVYPYYTYFVANAMDLAASVSTYKTMEEIPSGISKVVLVPKDSRGPRLICMEPLEFQWVQQGLKKNLEACIERHKLTRGHINFKDQEVNRELARIGSYRDSKIVTLDMKEASDRVSLWLVTELFSGTKLLKKLLGTRTEATELPTGEIHLLRKFAPMGSALCFPIESLVHWALSVASLNVEGLSLKRALKAVYVYGDDIIIKGENHVPLLDHFPSFYLKFNEAKCCTTGIFRESCGMDAVLGQSVTPLKIKKQLPKNPYDANGYVSYLEYCNRLWNDAYYSSSNYLLAHVQKIYGRVPHTRLESDCPGLFTRVIPPSNTHMFKKRWNSSLQRTEYRVKKVRGHDVVTPLDRCEYQRKLLISSNEFVAGIYTVPRRIKLQLGWSQCLN